MEVKQTRLSDMLMRVLEVFVVSNHTKIVVPDLEQRLVDLQHDEIIESLYHLKQEGYAEIYLYNANSGPVCWRITHEGREALNSEKLRRYEEELFAGIDKGETPGADEIASPKFQWTPETIARFTLPDHNSIVEFLTDNGFERVGTSSVHATWEREGEEIDILCVPFEQLLARFAELCEKFGLEP